MRGIEADGFLEGGHGPAEVLHPPKVPALQVAAVGLEVVGLRSSVHGVRAGPEPGLHRVDDARGDLVLDGEDVDGLPVEPLRPELVAARDVGELRRDAQPDAGRAYAALEHVAHAERTGDGGQVVAVPPRTERRGAGRDADPVDPHQRVHDLLGHTFAEILLVLRRAHVGERQDRDRDLRGRRVAGRGRRLGRHAAQRAQHVPRRREAVRGALPKAAPHDALESRHDVPSGL